MFWRLAITAAVCRHRRCVVCREKVRRSDWRARVLLEAGCWAPAHWGCVSPSDAMIQRFTEDAAKE